MAKKKAVKKEEEKNYKTIVLTIIGLIVLIALVIGVTYAAFTYSRRGDTVNTITTGTITLVYQEGKDGIAITDALPITDDAGKVLSNSNEYFDFTVESKMTGANTITYEVTADKVTDGDMASTLENGDVRLYLERCEDGTSYAGNAVLEPSYYTPLAADDSFGAKAGEMILDTETVSTSKIYYYRLRMWVDKDYVTTSQSKRFSVKVNVYAKDASSITIDANNVSYGEGASQTSVNQALNDLHDAA